MRELVNIIMPFIAKRQSNKNIVEYIKANCSYANKYTDGQLTKLIYKLRISAIY